jgi:flavodoxin
MKALVVFYSRTGRTRALGHRIAAALNADIEELGDRVNRRGIRGYLRSGRDAWYGRTVALLPLRHDPAAYDLVVVGTPIWNRSVSSPVRSFLRNSRPTLHDVAFFCTLGGIGSRRVLEQMQHESGKLPIATLAVTEHQLRSAALPEMVRGFVGSLRTLRHAA